eukprot:147316-Prymnesium_polylepis.1
MAWDLVPADAASALPRLRSAATTRPSARPAPTCSATSTPRSSPRSIRRRAAQEHHRHSLCCFIETQHARHALARRSPGRQSRAGTVHAIGHAHAEAAAELEGASSGWASAASS